MIVNGRWVGWEETEAGGGIEYVCEREAENEGGRERGKEGRLQKRWPIMMDFNGWMEGGREANREKGKVGGLG